MFYLRTKKTSLNKGVKKQAKPKKKSKSKSIKPLNNNEDESEESDVELDIFSVEEEDGLEYTKVSKAKKMINELDPLQTLKEII